MKFTSSITASITAVSLLSVASLNAAVVAEYNFTGGSMASSDSDALSTASSMSLAPVDPFKTNVEFGLPTVQEVANNGTAIPVTNERFHVGGGDTGSTSKELAGLDNAIPANDYVSFKVNTDGNALDFDTLDLDHGLINAVFDNRARLEGYDWNIFVMASVKGFALGQQLGVFTFPKELIQVADFDNWLVGTATTAAPLDTGAVAGVLDVQRDTQPVDDWYFGDIGEVTRSLDLSGVAELQSFTGEVEFRLYFGDASESDTRAQTIDNVKVTATETPTSTAIPEPSAFILGLFGSLALIFRRRR